MNGKLDALKKLGSYVDGMEPKKEEDGMDEQLMKGIEVEMEHTEDPEEAKKIAMDHLAEDPQYYSKLDEMGEGEEGEVKELAEEMKDDGGFEEGPKISISMLARKPKGNPMGNKGNFGKGGK